MRVGDWLPYSCGDRVRLKADPRHEGTVQAVLHGSAVRVRWEETGWLSDEKFAKVELVAVKPQYGTGFHRMKARMGADAAEALRQQVVADQAAALSDAGKSRAENAVRDRETYRGYPVPKGRK